ncbi:hypothetical protein [Bacillus atrophaeus]|uniref:hypothetical protein n=1 Tax=Bacillus atrophaeus TaxID=1452 RepID=UPI00227E6041|nr:hypothetical protein [Bacillus atrophaeus]MCY8466419.1 hypothetical protein [Bacillus atrophaeus]MCY8478878.1 hypothetical protein [Bacillus atrophaeus]
MEIPKINDIVYVDSNFYTGEARVVYINMKSLYSDHLFPIQCEIDDENLNKIDIDFNHGQRVVRFSLSEVLGIQLKEKFILGDEQGSLFDDFS